MWRQSRYNTYYIDPVGRVWMVFPDGHSVLCSLYRDAINTMCQWINMPSWGPKCLTRIDNIIDTAFKELQQEANAHVVSS